MDDKTSVGERTDAKRTSVAPSPTSADPNLRAAPPRRISFFRWLFAVLAVAGIFWGVAERFHWFEDRYDFKSESRSILNGLTGGEETATAVYEAASFPFRETFLLTSFVDRTERMSLTLGKFKEIESVKEIEMLKTIGGKTARIKYSLVFENTAAHLVHTTGELSYLQGQEGAWRLLGFHINVPIMLGGKFEALASQYDRIKAPDAVVAQVSHIMGEIAAGNGLIVRGAASPPFRESTSEEGFQTLLAGYDKELGRFKRVLAVLSSGQNSRKDKATVHALLEYEDAKTTGTFKFIKVEDVWLLLYFKIVVPEPLLPARREPAHPPQESRP